MSEGAARLVSVSKAYPHLADSLDARLEALALALAGAASILPSVCAGRLHDVLALRELVTSGR